jgi:hypothetical protein
MSEMESQVLEIRNGRGEVLFTVYARIGKEETKERKEAEEKKEDAAAEEKRKKSPNNEEQMSGAQKRYLFRILADQGIEGEKAHEHLKKVFAVETLKEVTKAEASREIDRMLRESKGGEEE